MDVAEAAYFGGCTEHYVGATAVGVALGVGVEALMGRLIPKWHLRFQLRPKNAARNNRPSN